MKGPRIEEVQKHACSREIHTKQAEQACNLGPPELDPFYFNFWANILAPKLSPPNSTFHGLHACVHQQASSTSFFRSSMRKYARFFDGRKENQKHTGLNDRKTQA